MLSADDPAPDFDLTGVYEGEIGTYRLSKFARRGPAILAFYPFDFAPESAEYLRDLRETDWFEYVDDLAILGVSTDGPYAHAEFARQNDLPFPLLSDSGGVADTYGVLADRVAGMASVVLPAAVLVDTEMRIRYLDRRDDPSDRPALAPLREAVSALDD